MPRAIKLFTGNAHSELAQEVAAYLGIPVGDAIVTKFSDGEIMVHIRENVRGYDVFVLQPTCSPVNDNILELLLMVDAFKRASAKRITAVMPYYGYARQDRKVQPRVPISDYVKKKYTTNKVVIVSPDAGGVERARSFAKMLQCSIAIIDKRREAANISQIMNVIGEVEKKDTIILDDMIDTGGTIIQAAEALNNKGARQVVAACTHAVLSGAAVEKVNNSVLRELIVTNTIPFDSKKEQCKKLTVLSIAPLLGEAIKRIHEESSISSLFV
jgi:ribose-phosphate pyrophosphokinase